MSTKIPISRLASLIAEKTGCDPSEAVQFIKDLFIIVEDRVSKGEEITISGLGTFSKSAVAGEPIAYCPDKEFAAELNEDFSSFCPVTLPPEFPDEELSAIGTEPTTSAPTTEEEHQETEEGHQETPDTAAPDTASDQTKALPTPEPSPEIILPEDSPSAEEPASGPRPVKTAEEPSAAEETDAAEPTENKTVGPANGSVTTIMEEKSESQSTCDRTDVSPSAPTVDLSASAIEEAVEKKPKKETKGNDTACIPEAVEEYVIVQKKKNYFWLGMLLGLLLGFALGLMALFAYLVQNMKISLEDLIF